MNMNSYIIYKIYCNDDDKLFYIGSTKNFSSRKSSHKSSFNNPNDKSHNKYLYKIMRENGNWDNWTMTPIKTYICDKRQAELYERETIEELKPTLNKNCPFNTLEERIEKTNIAIKKWTEKNHDKIIEKKREYYKNNKDKAKEYNEKNKEIIKEKSAKYREQNREKIRERDRQKITCVCGLIHNKSNKSRHMKSKFHIENC